jgi:hypothetical protein
VPYDAPYDYYFATTDDEAKSRAEFFRELDPFPDLPAALLSSEHVSDYVRVTGLLHPFCPTEDRLKPASYEVRAQRFIRWDDDGRKIITDVKEGDLYELPENSIVFVQIFTDETHNSDGRHVSYLKSPAFSALDPQLHRTLEGLLSAGDRSVKAVARSGILPDSTVFFDTPIFKSSGFEGSRQLRERQRVAWLRKAFMVTANCDLIFFDPDNGLETASVARHSPKGGKYVFWDELMLFWDC